MKKVLSTVAALGLVVGVAATASAMDFSVTGKYEVSGYAISEGATAGGVQLLDDTAMGANSWYEHNMRIYPTLKVNDQITMKADIRLADWDTWPDATSNNITANKIYMEYMSPVGKIRIGMTPAAAWGSPYLNSASSGNRIMWWPNFVSDPFSLLVFTQKIAENDGGTAGTGATTDQDTDSYYAGVGYKADIGKFDLAYYHVRNGAADTDGSNLWFNAQMGIGPATVIAEVAHAFGDSSATVDKDAWGAMVLAMGNLSDNLTVGGVYFMATGDDADSADNEQMLGNNGTGKDWEPLYIMTGDYMGVLNGDGVGANAFVIASGVHAVGAFADLAVSPKLTLHAAIGGGWADETLVAGQEDDYGWEFDLGASYKLLDNLTYDVHLGYWAVGDYVEVLGEPNNVTLLSNHLSMKF